MNVTIVINTSPGLTIPTAGDTETGKPWGTQNSNILGPCVGATPLITALSVRDSGGLLTVTCATVVAFKGVAANVIAE